MARLLTSLLVVFSTLAESGVGNSLREKRQVPTLPPPLPSRCISSTYVTPSLLSTPLSATISTECSLGKVKRSLEAGEELRAGGIYLMPEAVSCNGTLVFAETCAFLNQLMDRSRFRLRVGVLRERNGVYRMVHRGIITITSSTPNATQECGSLTQQWPVIKGDRIFVQIQNSCDVSNRTCPAQANLIDTASCASALYLPFGTSPLTNFRAVGVNLNVRVSIEPTTPPPQPTTMVQGVTLPLQPTADLLTALGSFDLEPSALHSPSIWLTADMLQATSTRSYGSAYLSSSSIFQSPDTGHESGTEISHGGIGGIVVAALAVITVLVILLTISAYVYWRKVLKKRKRKYKYSERVDGQAAAVVSYHLSKNDASYEEPTENMIAKESVNKCTNSNSTDSSYRMSFRNRGYSEANAYSLIDEEVKQQTVNTSQPYSELHSAEYAYATTSTSTSNPPPPGNMSGHYEVDEDYGDPYWDPSSKEDELRMQLLKLKVQEIPREDLQIQEYLGSGQFGTVNRGMWSPSPSSSSPGVEVAVKSLEGESTEEERVKFLQEAAIMGQFKHPNIIRIAGVVTTTDPLLIVCEMMHKGDLHHHLLSMRSHSGVCVEMPAQLLSFCRQIAFGMTYLSNKSYVHRDLAARNILVSMYDICKIADFGLSRDLQNEDYYVSHGGKIPVKWTAPEALNYRKYSTASDVWSYGVLLYEIWAMGIKPFHDYTNSESLKKVSAGYRLPPPPGCPRAIYELMIHSWHSQPASRPTFTDMVVLLQRPDFQLLWWSEEDKVSYSEKARTLGGPVEDGEEMYMELQKMYFELAAD